MQKIRFKFEVFCFLHQKYSRNRINVYWWKTEKKLKCYIGGRHSSEATQGVGCPSGYGNVRVLGAARTDAVRWPDCLDDFSGNFSGNFSGGRFCPWYEIFALWRTCLGFIRLPSALLITSEECLDRLMWVGQLNVRCMSGNWIASVCRLPARAANYRPTILLSWFTSIFMLVDLIRGLCCVPIRKELLSFA